MSTYAKMSFILMLCISIACANETRADYGLETTSSADATEAYYMEEDAQDESFSTPSTMDESVERRIIKNGQLTMQVTDVSSTTDRVKQLTEQYQGFISNSHLTTSNYRKGSAFTIRVPVENFDPLLEALSAEAIFLENRSVQAQDVTQEYLDVQIRLQTKKDVRDRYIDILRNKAKTVKDVLLAEEQIRVIQEEIESAEGRLKYLKDRTALGTIQLEIYQEIEYRPTPTALKDGFWQRVGRGFENGWDGLVGFLVLLVNMWPLLLLILVLLLWKGKWAGQLFSKFRK